MSSRSFQCGGQGLFCDEILARADDVPGNVKIVRDGHEDVHHVDVIPLQQKLVIAVNAVVRKA